MTPDEQIRTAFKTQKRLDETVAPGFVVPTTPQHPRWRYNLATIATAATAAVVATLLITNLPSRKPAPTTTSAAFEQASQSISLHLFAATSTDWQSPTEFLLDYDTTLTEY